MFALKSEDNRAPAPLKGKETIPVRAGFAGAVVVSDVQRRTLINSCLELVENEILRKSFHHHVPPVALRPAHRVQLSKQENVASLFIAQFEARVLSPEFWFRVFSRAATCLKNRLIQEVAYIGEHRLLFGRAAIAGSGLLVGGVLAMLLINSISQPERLALNGAAPFRQAPQQGFACIPQDEVICRAALDVSRNAVRPF